MRVPVKRQLPLGRSDFATLRERNAVYVDKTAQIHELCRTDQFLFFVRPRRFGKSLLVSTFESLFRHGLRDFEGLEIERLWTDKTYNVLHLDFSSTKPFDSTDEFLSLFDRMIDLAAGDAGLEIPRDAGGPVDRLANFLSRQSNGSLVLLIDEYDAPLTEKLDDEVLFEGVRKHLSRFYGFVKQYDRALRFLFITGITKVSGTSIFSAFNNLTDISWIPRYGSLLGYTEEEIRKNFGDYLTKARTALGLTDEVLWKELKAHYNGYAFERTAGTRVYCPWSILKFLNQPENGFQDYWYESGGRPTVLLRYLEKHEKLSPRMFEGEERIRLDDLMSSRKYDGLSPAALFVQTGYLTIKKQISQGLVTVGYPNSEVASGMARLWADVLLPEGKLAESGVYDAPQILACEDASGVVAYLNGILNLVSYDSYPVRDESSLRFGIRMLLLGGALMPQSEVRGALGRSDLEVRVGGRHWVFEFKFALLRRDRTVVGRSVGTDPLAPLRRNAGRP